MNRTRKGIACIICILMLAAVFSLATSAATPTYTVSAKYQESQFYSNLLSVPLSGDQSTDVLAVALSQLGYHEGNSDSDFGGLNTIGTRNFVEYNRLYGKLDNGEGNGVSYGYYWCASFVNWCMQQAGLTKEQTAAREVSCYRWVLALEEAGMYEKAHEDYVPKSGDMIFFMEAGTAAWRRSTHVGLVRYVEGDTVYTIEGNARNNSPFSQGGDYVCLRSYSLSDPFIVGFGLPNYNTNDAIPDVDYSDSLHCTGLCISEEALEVYDSANGEDLLGKVDSFHTFEICEIHGEWAKIKASSNGTDIEGWVIITEKTHQMTANNISFKVTYIAPEAINVPKEEVCSEETKIILSSKIPQKTGARFIGWSLTENAEKPDYAAGDTVITSTDLTLYAVWDNNMFTVVFRDNDGNILKQVNGFSGDKLTAPQAPEKSGYVFDGWDSEIPSAITESATYTAIYSKIPEQTSESDTGSPEESTDTDTSVETEAPTESGEVSGSTAESESIPTETESQSGTESSGCGSAALSSALIIVLPALVCISVKKKKN